MQIKTVSLIRRLSEIARCYATQCALMAKYDPDPTSKSKGIRIAGHSLDLAEEADLFLTAPPVTAKASIAPNEVAVTYQTLGGYECISFPVSGWDEVKGLQAKVLVFDGRQFRFTGWDSDRNVCFFKRSNASEPNVATFA